MLKLVKGKEAKENASYITEGAAPEARHINLPSYAYSK
jgi:hypothetical protein